MFTPKKIRKALEKLFDLFDEDILKALHENYDEEIEDISPYWLAKAFNANATKLYGYRSMSHIGDGVNFYGKTLTKKKAALLLRYVDNSIENDHFQMLNCSELWLLEDMSFAHVRCVATLIKGDERPDAATEYREFVRRVARKDDIFFEPDDLLCHLDDSCTFAQVMNKATICEPTQLRGIGYVSVIAMEMTGNARANKDRVWIPYKESFDLISDSIPCSRFSVGCLIIICGVFLGLTNI